MIHPVYFCVHQFERIDLDMFVLPKTFYNVYLVQFSECELEKPDSDPMAMYNQDGNRKYLWRDSTWSEIELPVKKMIDTIGITMFACQLKPVMLVNYQKVLKLLNLYSTCPAPNPRNGKMFCRAIMAGLQRTSYK